MKKLAAHHRKYTEDTTMSEEKKPAVTEEVKEEFRKLTEEELEQVTGGSRKGPTEYASVLIGAAVGGVVTTLAGQPCAGEDIRGR